MLPRGIATFEAFENAMTLDIAMGGSTNTVLHLLAAAHEGGVAFTMTDIDRLSRRVPVPVQGGASVAERASGRRAPRRRHHGHPGRAGPRRAAPPPTCRPCIARRLGQALEAWDMRAHAQRRASRTSIRAAPGGVPTQSRLQPGPRAIAELDLDRAKGCIRDAEHAFSKDGGLAVLYGNIATDGCIVKTAGVDESDPEVHRHGPRLRKPGRRGARASSAARSKAGDVVVIRYEGPRGGPGMQEMLYPTSYLKSKGLGKVLRADHRRALLRRHLGPFDRPRLAGSGRRRR